MQNQRPPAQLSLSSLARLRGRCSLKTRLIAMAIGLFVAFIWVLVFFSLTVLEGKFQQVLAAEQFASTQRLAADLDAKLNERLQTLAKVAENLPGDLQPAVLDPYLQQLGATPLMFPGGVVVIGVNGKAIADFPVVPGRRGTYYTDRDYFRNVLDTRSAYIGRPVIGRVLKRPVITMAVPVFDNAGKLRAVLTGITDLSAPNFLKAVSEPSMAGKGELFVFSLHDGTIIAATDSKLTMKSAMERGRNRLYERVAGGFEGSDIGVNTQGIEKLYSAKRVPTANWVVVSALPTEVAFGAVSTMQKYVYVAAGVMTLIAVLLIRLAARRMLAPLDAAGAAMRRMTEGQTPMVALPIERDDEIGQLIGNFNLLVAERNRAEQVQMNLNRALRLLSNCNMALVHAEREQSLLDEICRLVVTSGGYRMAWVGYAEQDADKTVRPVSSYGDTAAYLSRTPISWGESVYGRGPAGYAIRTREAQVNADFLLNAGLAPWREAAAESGFRSSIALPLIAQGKAFGVLSIYSPDPDSFSEDEVRLLRELANDLAFGIDTLRTRLEREAAEEKLAFLAHHDPLTSLPNRVLLRDRFDRAIAGAVRVHAGVAMLTLDLDNFKRVNDSLGHDVGDQLLLHVVQRLHRCIRDTDTISRQGGDEFVILLTAVSDSSIAGRIAQAILDVMAEPFEIGNHTITTSFSIGISMYPNDGHDFDTLLKNADTALYHAKDNGRDTYHFFANTMNVDALARMQLHANLRKAVKDNEFLLHYQPQVDIASGATVGVEALIRWQHQDELVPPSRFIPLAEETGLIVRIGEWVLNEACRQARAWIDEGLPPMVVAVNLSAHQFKRGNVLQSVTEALERSGLPAAHLELELTESILLQDTTVVMETLRKLKKLGVHLSIDDFGTGYSSMSYLKQLSVDKLKIDQSFVRDLATDPDDAAIVKAIIQLGQALQLCVVAEGVETEDQLSFLRRYGCDQAQGYLISRPVAAAEISAMSAVP